LVLQRILEDPEEFSWTTQEMHSFIGKGRKKEPVLLRGALLVHFGCIDAEMEAILATPLLELHVWLLHSLHLH
jgi:hypothetical protein